MVKIQSKSRLLQARATFLPNKSDSSFIRNPAQFFLNSHFDHPFADSSFGTFVLLISLFDQDWICWVCCRPTSAVCAQSVSPTGRRSKHSPSAGPAQSSFALSRLHAHLHEPRRRRCSFSTQRLPACTGTLANSSRKSLAARYRAGSPHRMQRSTSRSTEFRPPQSQLGQPENAVPSLLPRLICDQTADAARPPLTAALALGQASAPPAPGPRATRATVTSRRRAPPGRRAS